MGAVYVGRGPCALPGGRAPLQLWGHTLHACLALRGQTCWPLMEPIDSCSSPHHHLVRIIIKVPRNDSHCEVNRCQPLVARATCSACHAVHSSFAFREWARMHPLPHAIARGRCRNDRIARMPVPSHGTKRHALNFFFLPWCHRHAHGVRPYDRMLYGAASRQVRRAAPRRYACHEPLHMHMANPMSRS